MAALELAERKVIAVQRFIKRIIEREIFKPVVEQVGLDPVKAECRLNWGTAEKPETPVADLLRAAQLNLIRIDEFRNMMKKAGWELMEPEEEATWEGFYYGSQNRLRYIPETSEQRAEYSNRVKIVRQHVKKFPAEKRSEVEKMLRKYSSRDLTDANIHSDSDEELLRVFDDIKGLRGYYDDRDRSIHIRRGHEERALHHEMGHFLAHKKHGTTDLPKYKKYLEGKYKEIIETFLGPQAVEDEGEVLADGFWGMMRYPGMARWLIRKYPEMEEYFHVIMDDLDYRVSGIRRKKRRIEKSWKKE